MNTTNTNTNTTETNNTNETSNTTETSNTNEIKNTNSATDTENHSEEEVTVKTFTQEDVDKIVAKRLDRERSKLQKEFAEKLNQGVEDRMTEAEKLSKMSASEKKEYELNKRIAELEAQQKEFQLKELQSTARGMLLDLGYDTESVKALSEYVKYEDAESASKSIKELDKVIKDIVDKRVNAEVEKRLVTNTKPPVGKQTAKRGNTWEDYLAHRCTYAQYKEAQGNK